MMKHWFAPIPLSTARMCHQLVGVPVWLRFTVLEKGSAILMNLVARIQMINPNHGDWRRGALNVKPGELVEPDYLSEPYPVSWNQVGSEAGGRP